MEKVVVTGASRGLGRHCATRLMEAGFHVIGLARSPDPEAPCEMPDHDVTVNVIAPGPIDTNLIAKVPRDAIRQIVDRQIIPRQAEPEDAWRIIALILRPESSMITGEIFHIGGI